MPKTFKVKFKEHHDTLEEIVSARENNSDVKVNKLKTRDRKLHYKNSMKDSSRFSQTQMSHADHPTLFLQSGNNDTLEFFYSEEFLIFITRDPEIEDDPSGPKEALTKRDNNNDVPWIYDVARANPNNPQPGEEFIAGPYKVNAGAPNQRYYKYSILTKSGLSLDPDIVVEL